jgi:hypothetical protein
MTRTKKRGHASDRLSLGWVVAYFAAFVLIVATFDPATHKSTGVHQQIGECYVEAKDITGLTRHRYLCATDYGEDFDFACVGPRVDAAWYTVCGRPHASFGLLMSAVSVIGVAGSTTFWWLLGRA